MNFYKSVIASFEWRLVAVCITVFVLTLNHIPLGDVGWITVQLQLALFMGQAVWMWLKSPW